MNTVLLGSTPAARADSPLTSTNLADAYADLPAVQLARQTKVADAEVLLFLSGDAPTDQKAAVINALGWNVKGQRNGYRFLAGLAGQRGLKLQDMGLQDLQPEDQFILGYLLAMDDYNQLSPLSQTAQEDLWRATPLQLLSQAAYALPEDFTVNFVRAIVQSQGEFSHAWCSVYLGPQRILAQFPEPKRNLRSQAVATAMDYLKLYEADCQKSGVGVQTGQQSPQPELNQIYKIAEFQNHIVTATQGGIVIWDPQIRKALTTRKEQICTSLIVWSQSLWVGCQHRLLRFDGQTWKTYRHDPQTAEGGFKLIAGSKGTLLASHRGQLWQFDGKGDRFTPAASNLGTGQGYDLLYRRNGEQWRIDFLSALWRNQQQFPLKSQRYPGADPRAFYEDPSGQLWVIDFVNGFYRYEDTAQKFVPVKDVTSKSSAIAVDRRHQRTYLLHYTAGLYIREKGQAQPTFINLSELLYMRDLLVDHKGDIWVAGWNQLLRLRKQSNTWEKISFQLSH
ncbi:MAG: hypothetical protein HC790_07205 [Acaryochloridaceae cyanobacterium CSU_3_4]|nr:hypothetical protein [Acaryochloridaceae cyanobacterium CSU_3_4]